MSLDIPERFKDGDDEHVDVTAPKRNNTMSMNQSIFSMIARAGQQSQTDLGALHEMDSGDSEDEGKRKVQVPYHSLDGAARLSRLSSANDFGALPQDLQHGKADKSKHRRSLSENKLLRSLPKLKMSNRKEVRSEDQTTDQMSSSQFLPPRPPLEASLPVTPSEQAPKAKAKVTPGEEIYVEKGRRSRLEGSTGLDKGKAPLTLATRLQQIFEFGTVEEVISEYPCWLLQSILLQGYMYITQKHICFYAYIPKKHVSPLCNVLDVVC